MRWEKIGLIWGPAGSIAWAEHSALQPTALLLDDRTIRVYVGCRDREGISRVGFVDLDAADPRRVRACSEAPVLDIGPPGAFDDNGVVPTAIVRHGHDVRLYYAGYQIPRRVKFLVFSGLASSSDAGKTFVRVRQVPITDRTDGERCFRVIHSVLPGPNVWRTWYGAGSDFEAFDGRTLPVYDIRYMESNDGVAFPGCGQVVVGCRPDEHRVGRPNVIKIDRGYLMFFGAATRRDNYRLEYAESTDGLTWERRGGMSGLDPTPGSWDSKMMGYPCVVRYDRSAYLFYNGNDYGREGFGCARLVEW